MTANMLYAEMLTVIRRDQARRSRWRRFGAFLGKLFTALLTGFLRALVGGWEFMLVVGVVHAEWLPQVPTLGFWWAVLISWLLRSSLSAVTPTKSEKAER